MSQFKPSAEVLEPRLLCKIGGFIGQLLNGKVPTTGGTDLGIQIPKINGGSLLRINPLDASAKLWGDVGEVLYPAAAVIMADRSASGRPLNANEKAALYPIYGNLVNEVTLHFNVTLINQMHLTGKLGGYSFNFDQGGDTLAQTYGDNIYFAGGDNQPSTWPTTAINDTNVSSYLATLTHEMRHVQQFQNYGNSNANFGYHYLYDWKEANYNYSNIAEERDAYNIEDTDSDSVLVNYWDAVNPPGLSLVPINEDVDVRIFNYSGYTANFAVQWNPWDSFSQTYSVPSGGHIYFYRPDGTGGDPGTAFSPLISYNVPGTSASQDQSIYLGYHPVSTDELDTFNAATYSLGAGFNISVYQPAER